MSRRISAVLIDLSGTLHIDDFVIPGAIPALKRYGNVCSSKLMVHYGNLD